MQRKLKKANILVDLVRRTFVYHYDAEIFRAGPFHSNSKTPLRIYKPVCWPHLWKAIGTIENVATA